MRGRRPPQAPLLGFGQGLGGEVGHGVPRGHKGAVVAGQHQACAGGRRDRKFVPAAAPSASRPLRNLARGVLSFAVTWADLLYCPSRRGGRSSPKARPLVPTFVEGGCVRHVLTCCVVLLLCVGCATVGSKFAIEKAEELQPGVSTIDDAIHLIGKPTSESTYADGSQLLQWSYAQGSLVGGSGAHLAILFDSNGTMVRITHRSRM